MSDSSTEAYRNLVVATLGLTLTFWAWNLLSPLATHFQRDLGLGSFAQAVVVAVPLLVGSLGRIPVGALSDRYGAQVLLPLVSAATVVPVLLLIPARHSYVALLIVGVLLGVAGTTFAIGVPLVNSWFAPARRGFALGVYGMGMGGMALSGYFTPRLYDRGQALPFILVALALAGYSVLAFLLLTDRPDRAVPTEPLPDRVLGIAQHRVSWELAALYAVAFGGIVAFGIYLPTYLRTWYDLGAADAGTRAAGFVLVAVAFRPFGGWLADRVHPGGITAWALGVVGLFAIWQAFAPSLGPIGTFCFLVMAAGLGTASGSVIALLSHVVPQDRMGSTAGIVGAVGGLGGLIPLIVLAAVYSSQDSFAIGFMLLSNLALVGCFYCYARMRGSARR